MSDPRVTVHVRSGGDAPLRQGWVVFVTGKLERLSRKVARALHDRTFGPKLRRHVGSALYVPAVSIALDRALPPADRRLDLTTGFRDHRGAAQERRCSEAALDRLAVAFRLAEADRDQSCPPQLAVRGLWAEWLDIHYQPLRAALRKGDLVALRRLFENLHREPMSTGVGGTVDDLKAMPRPVAHAYYRSLWCRYRDLLESVRPDWSDVASPIVGNPVGAWIDGRLVQLETLRHAHHATVLLDLLSDTAAPRILEVGGGMGGQAFQCLALGKSRVTYTIVDLPEVASLAGYCLLAALGEDQVRLFGETTRQNPLVEVLPHWRITDVEASSADMVFNAHSFSEMDGASATFYLGQIERLDTRFFYHINHETRFCYRTPDGGQSVNRVGSEMVPSKAAFRLVSRKPQLFIRPENTANKGFAYLYERRQGAGGISPSQKSGTSTQVAT